jgi:GTPase SAR1 family protein
MLFFDLSDRNSFDSLEYWLSLIQDNTKELPAIVLVGNKCDLPGREVPETDITKFCESKSLPYFEASALANINVQSALLALVEEVTIRATPLDVVTIEPAEAGEKSCCSVI